MSIESSWFYGEIDRLIYQLQQLRAVAAEAQKEGVQPDGLGDPMLDKSVNELEVSVRSYNCLMSANIKTIGQLVQRTEADMLREHNFGKKSLNELKDVLGSIGLGFGMVIKNGRAVHCCRECGRLRY